MKKKLLSILLSLAMVIGMMQTMTITAFGKEDTPITTWAALQEAINAAPGEESEPAVETTTITLTQDLVATDADLQLSIPGYKNITIELAGHVLDRNLIGDDGPEESNDTIINIEQNATLNITDSNPNTLKHNFKVLSDGLWVPTNEATGAVEIESLTAYPETDAIITVTGGVLTGATVSGIINYGTLNLYAGNIVGNYTSAYGGGIMNNSILKMHGGKVSGNVAENGGGGIANEDMYTDNPDTTIVGGEITFNTSMYIAGGIEVYAPVTIGGTAVVKNNIGYPDDTATASDVEYDGGELYIAASPYEPKNGMCVGLLEFETVENAKSGDEQYFFTDDTTKVVKFNTDHLEIVDDSGYTITNSKPQSEAGTNNGYISIAKETASVGATVEFTVVPASEYVLKSLTVYKTGEPTTTISTTKKQGNTYTFEMPAYDVTLTAEFEKAHTHNDITFTSWTESDSLPNTSGSYYLTKDVTIESAWLIPQGTTLLCLNGHVIKTKGGIEIAEGSRLHLYDCDKTTQHYFFR